MWRTYKDAVFSDDEDVFDESAEYTAYAKGTGLPAGNYTVAFWDGGGTLRQVETGLAGPDISGARNFDVADTAGTWYASVYPDGLVPAGHGTTTNLQADYAFYATASAIPEFPTVIGSIVAAGLCFGIYYWLRKRYRKAGVKNLIGTSKSASASLH